MRPRLLDLFCKAGGAAAGYERAGFEVWGVDIEPQPDYPHPARFVQADALTFAREHGAGFDAIAASPPCLGYSNLNAYNRHEYPLLIADTIRLLQAIGRPWVVENVDTAAVRAEMAGYPVVRLCGPQFGLRVYRHRLFASNLLLLEPPHEEHRWLCARNGYLPTVERPFMTVTGGRHSRAWVAKAAEYLGVPWMRTVEDVSNAIPPAYTEYLGAQVMAAVAMERAA
jgi:DNA (cytosine-5)-methyltransferase 1